MIGVQMRKQQGLTLMELMVTITILGVLVGVAFPASITVVQPK